MYHLQNNYGFDYRPSIKSLIKAKKRRGTKIDLWETPALIPVHEETFSLKVTLCFLYFKKSDQTLSSLLQIPFCFSLNIIPLSQTLWNAFEISRKNTSHYKPMIKRLRYFVGYRLKLLNTGVSWLQTTLVWGNQIVFNKKPEYYI